MIHIATVHWKSDQWIDVQLRYFRRHVQEPYRIYAFLNDLPGDHASKFYYATSEAIEWHSMKLNLLGDMIGFNARDEQDLLIFVDGDAFPIGDVVAFARERLERHRLIAVQRKENHGDPQPHPCFCVTTVAFWKQIRGSWHGGYWWTGPGGGKVTDVGGLLLEKLERAGVEWLPLLRTNKVDLHPLWFGIYGDLVYHHGAGFRRERSVPANRGYMRPVSRADRARVFRELGAAERLLYRLPIGTLRRRIVGRRMDEVVERNLELLDRVYRKIRDDDEFYREFLELDGTPDRPGGGSPR